MAVLLRSLVYAWVSLALFNTAHGSVDVQTKQSDICSTFRISADEYVDTGLSLRKISADRRKETAGKLQSAIIGAAGNIVGANSSAESLDTTEIKKYANSLILFVVPGMIVLIFSFLGVVPILVARCCIPQKCCPPKKPVPAPDGDAVLPDNQRVGYTRVELSAPVVSYSVLALVVLIFIAVGIASSGTILQGMTDGMCSLEILVGDLDIFMTDLADAIKNVSDHGVGLLDKVAAQVDTSDLQLQVNHTIGNMSLLIAWLSNQTYQGIPIFDPDDIASAEEAILSARGSAIQQLSESRAMVLDKLVRPRQFITNILEMVEMATNSTAKMLDQANYLLQEQPIEIMKIPLLLGENVYKGMMGVLAELRDSNLVVGASFFSFIAVTIPLNIIGIFIIKCKGKCANCCGLFITRLSCTFLFVAMTLVAILGLILLPISIIFSDTCVLLDSLPQDVRLYAEPFLTMEMTYTGGILNASSSNDAPAEAGNALIDATIETGLRAIDACWDDENLMDALNLTDTLGSFVNNVDFSALDNLSLDPVAMFEDFFNFKTKVAALTPESFGLNLSTILTLEAVCYTCNGFNELPTDFSRGKVTAPTAAAIGTNTAASTSRSHFCDNKCNDTSLFPVTNTIASSTASTDQIYEHCRTTQSKACDLSEELREHYEYLSNLTAEANTRFEAQSLLVDGLSDHVTSLHRKLNTTRSEFGPFAASLTGINKYSSCYFVVQFFDRTHDAVCGSPSTLSGMMWFATCLAVVPVLSIGLIVSTMCINCRYGGIGQDHHNHIRDIHDQTKHHVKKGIKKLQNHVSRNSSVRVRTVKVAPMPAKDMAFKRTGTARTMQRLQEKHKPFTRPAGII